jgi:hypothetical protein
MRFVLVNERAPRGGPKCVHCGKPITIGYLRDLSSRLPYCDHACFVGGNIKITPTIFRLGTGIDSLPFRSLSSW